MPNQTVAGGVQFLRSTVVASVLIYPTNKCIHEQIGTFYYFQCGGVTKDHYRQMVLADEKDIAIQVTFNSCTGGISYQN